MTANYRICTKCVMDTTDPKITFDAGGVCTHCRRYALQDKKDKESGEYTEEKLKEIVGQIKEVGKNNRYDCVLGVSGGVDSTYLAWLAFQFGLRPLCVHVDNGWNTELSNKNIELMLKKLNFDLYTHVIDWQEFRDIQLAFLKASVVDIELPTDQAIFGVIEQVAADKNIKYILSGTNKITESVMPFSWNHNKSDLLNIIAIHHRFGSVKLEKYPMLDPYHHWENMHIKQIKSLRVLDYLPYNVEDVKHLLAEKLGWQYYGGKHYESFFTRFYQRYILPVKFKIDKRRAHLSNLICAGQMTREIALEELKKDVYPTRMLEEDKAYVIKKLGLSEEEFQELMKRPARSHFDFPVGALPRL